MKLDILTPGDWQDSYESRYVSFGHEVNCLQDVFNVIKCEFENGKHDFNGEPLFLTYDIIIYDNDGNKKASWWFHTKTWELEVIPPIVPINKGDGKIWYKEPFGSQRYMIPVYYPEKVYKS